ncbi:hypothetical protein PV04_07908 [Phialophora macrospora]|uniref:Uncharacterized protein n=1 Tax=Phialophora macrospora TaxID=1851006 RepID=A0A0D2FFT5_9EURO|nr:hypothetical protein PV04_07908 [Phialophora macrospora]
MSTPQGPASELVQRWLSTVERDSTSPRSRGPEHGGAEERKDVQRGRCTANLNCATPTVLTLVATEETQARHTDSGPTSLEQTRHAHHHKERLGADQQYRHGKRGGAVYAEMSPSSRDNSFPNLAVAERLNNTPESHKNAFDDPSKKYARRLRHKTKEDTYEYKDVSEKHPMKHGATLTEDFRAPNVAAKRLTLKRTGPGFFLKGKSSGSTQWKGLPDLSFSEMTFLKRKRENGNTKKGESRPKKKQRQPPIQEISAFFSRPDDQQHKVTSPAKPSTVGSYVSWSVSSPGRRPVPTRQRSSLIAQSVERRQLSEDVGDNLDVHTSTHPNSALMDRFLNDITNDALFCGVDTFACREKKYYSLEDLKMLAEDTIVEAPRNQKALLERDIMRNANSTLTLPLSDELEEANSVRRATELSAYANERHVGRDTECLQPGPSLPKDRSIVGPGGQWGEVTAALTPSSSNMDDFDRDLWRQWIGGSDLSEKNFVADEDVSLHGFGFESPSSRATSNFWSQPVPVKDEDRQAAYDSIRRAHSHEAATDSCNPQNHARSLRPPRHVVEDPVVGFSGFSRAQIL